MAAADLLVPVPLHPRRLKDRGFNQALLLARAFPEGPVGLEAVTRDAPHRAPGGTQPQGAPGQRQGGLCRPDPALVKGKSVLLIDDLYTTGSTVKECARVLRRAGARRVEVLTVARVKHD